MDNRIAGLIAIALAALCCGLPLLVAAGILGGLTAWLASWPAVVVVVGIVAVAAVLFIWRRRERWKANECGNACEIEDQMAGHQTDEISETKTRDIESRKSRDPSPAEPRIKEGTHGNR